MQRGFDWLKNPELLKVKVFLIGMFSVQFLKGFCYFLSRCQAEQLYVSVFTVRK